MKRKLYSFLNIAGLTAGMSVAILIGLWIYDELTFNKNFDHHSRLAEVMVYQSLKDLSDVDITVSVAAEDPLRTNYPQDFRAVSLVSQFNNELVISEGDRHLSGSARWVQAAFPEMFSLNMISGSRNALKDPSTVLLSRSMAKALFGDSDPMNKAVRIDNRFDLQVGGIFEDLPSNCSFTGVKFLLPWENKENGMKGETHWENHSCALFVWLAPHANVNEVTSKIRYLPTPHVTGWHEEILLQPFDKLHLYNEFKNGVQEDGRIRFVLMFGVIGIFVLLLACINFMNLSTARSEQRAREVGIRKTAGSLRSQLVGQFLTESNLMSFLSLAFAVVAVNLVLPYFNLLSGKQIMFPWQNPEFWIISAGFALFTGIISGSYPAFYLSAFKPVNVLKGTLRAGSGTVLPRKILVVVQFSVSIALIIGTLVVFQQIQYAKDRPAGFNRNGLVTVWMKTPELHDHYESIRTDLLRTGYVSDVSESSQSPAHFMNNQEIEWPGKDPGMQVFFRDVIVSTDWGKTIGWKVVRGHDFSEVSSSDSSLVIINEKAADLMKLDDPIGTRIKYFGNDYTIAGVVRNMMTQSPYEPVEPTLFLMKGWYAAMIIRIKPGTRVHEALAAIEPVFRQYNPEAPFEYDFVDDMYARKFSNEERIGKLAGVFASLAIIISCLGIFGLAAFTAERRTKELGIRKVLGASNMNLWGLISREFVLLTGVSCFIAVPLALYFMTGWLKHYTYRTMLSWELFAVSIVATLLITFITVSFQALKAAMKNPVHSLRSE